MSSSAINDKQPVYGDMMTLYISQRISDGAILYEDIHGLYGPTTYLIGSSLLNWGFDYSGLKSFMIIVSLSSGFLVFLISVKLFSKYEIGLLSCAIYLFLPIHYGMAPVFHPDSIAVFFALLCVYFTLFEKRSLFVIASIFGLLAILTKIPVIPIIIVPAVYFAIKRNKMALFYLVPLVILAIFALSIISDEKSSENTKMLVQLLIENLDSPTSEIRDILWIEGFAFLLAGFGVLIFVKQRKHYYVLFLLIAGVLSYFATLIPGVGPYLINYAEPFIAIIAAFTIFYLGSKIKIRKLKLSQSHIIVILVVVMFTQFAIFDFPGRERIADWDGDSRSLVLNQIAEGHSALLQKYSDTDELVVASPMAAFKINRMLPLDDPSVDLLLIKNNMGFEYSKSELDALKNKLDNKEISILISYNSTERNLASNNYLQKTLFYPYNTEYFQESLLDNYDKFEEDGFVFYLPKDS